MYRVACGDVGFCLASGGKDAGETKIYQLDNGRWAAMTEQPAKDMTLLACPSRNLCIAGGSEYVSFWRRTS
jgi:hypothetical protein